jgi:signal transduction histidine kinase
MTSPQDHDQLLLAEGGTAGALIRNKERINKEFIDRVTAALDETQGLSRPMTLNTLPIFLTSLALTLSPSHSRSSIAESSNISLQHGTERAKMSRYSLSQLIHEYRILREILQEVLVDSAQPSLAEWKLVHASIDAAMADSASAFVKVHEGLREQFTATLTHDFRGPLGAAQNYLELIRRAGDKPEQRAHFATRAIDNLKRVSKMIDDLLDASRAHSGERLVIKPAECNVTDLALALVEDISQKEGDRFVLDAPEPIHGFADCDRVRQALHNLIENAVKYGSDDSPVTIRLLSSDGRMQLSVHNYGDPLPAEEQRSLFQAFRRTSSAEKSGKKGWGLGLVLVQAIAEAHGGVVTLESTLEEGTTFTIDILQDVREFHAGVKKQPGRP